MDGLSPVHAMIYRYGRLSKEAEVWQRLLPVKGMKLDLVFPHDVFIHSRNKLDLEWNHNRRERGGRTKKTSTSDSASGVGKQFSHHFLFNRLRAEDEGGKGPVGSRLCIRFSLPERGKTPAILRRFINHTQ